VTVWQKEGEKEAYRNMLERFPTGIVSVVSDSYDVYNACSKIWGEDLKDLVESRGEAGHVLTIRPDSGDPATVVCKLLNILSEKFGSTKNSKGYKVLPPYLRLLQGDGIGLESTKHILKEVQAAGFSSENVILGCGGGLLQKHNRDTLKFAFKCSLAIVNDKEIEVFKSPIDDVGKKSKKGKLILVRNEDGTFSTIEHAQSLTEADLNRDILETIFENGVLSRDQSLDSIRAITASSLI
jgi:nicotinamide phosphoribosyltransferase